MHGVVGENTRMQMIRQMICCGRSETVLRNGAVSQSGKPSCAGNESD